MKQPEKILGLIGKSLSHSFSPTFFDKMFKKMRLNYEYRIFELPTLDNIRTEIFSIPTLAGLNVTVPYKKNIIPFLDSMDDIAKQIAAVNVICYQNGQWIGKNSDWIGAKYSIELLCPQGISSALILGNGGAAVACIFALQNLNCSRIAVVTRLNPVVCPDIPTLTWEEVPDYLSEFELIINATPIGMYPNVHEAPPIPYHQLKPNQKLFDLIYNPSETKFLYYGKMKGCRTLNGYRMLEWQALAAWDFWQQTF
ncbi:MAG: shikimate dehydrogenase [Bacteroidia bacterium]|nr:shikimate dehydrogenase [Bacteroidia bacterium]